MIADSHCSPVLTARSGDESHAAVSTDPPTAPVSTSTSTAARKPVLPRRGALALALLAAIAVIAVIDFAAVVLLPVLVAGFLASLLNPSVRWLSARSLPRWLAALLVVSLGLGAFSAAGLALYEPAMEAASNSPRTVYRIKQKLQAMRNPLAEAGAVGEAIDMINDISGTTRPKPIAVVNDSGGVAETVGGVLRIAATLFSVIMLVYLFLIYGEVLFRRVVEIAPTLSDKRRTVSIVRAMQADISRYVATITLINIGLGAAVAGILFLFDVNDPLLWGALAAVLNFAPYIGPLLCFVVLSVVCLLQFDSLAAGITPPLLYLALNGLESQVVTPLILGRHFALNPLLILIWLLLWGWLWGIPGLLLGVPLLVTAKIVCDHTASLKPWARVLER